MPDKQTPILRLTVKATAATAANLLVTATGALSAAAGNALGPTYTAAKAGEQVAVTALGTSSVTAGAAIVAGAALQATAEGKVITRTSANPVVARALEAAAADGDVIEALIIPN